MPNNTIAVHPDGKTMITFIQDGHSYTDNFNNTYMSVTTLINKAFPQFDAEVIAERCAKRDKLTVEEVLHQWEEKRINSARLGTRFHENCENIIKNNLDKLHEPEDILEKIRFDKAPKIIENIKKQCNPILMESEKLIFSPAFKIAGSIDLLVKISDLKYAIFDWKILSKDLLLEGYNHQTGCILPTLNIQNSNYWHYALQLQIYENILKSEGYVNPAAQFTHTLIVWNGQNFHAEKLPAMSEAWSLIAWRSKFNTEKVK